MTQTKEKSNNTTSSLDFKIRKYNSLLPISRVAIALQKQRNTMLMINQGLEEEKQEKKLKRMLARMNVDNLEEIETN